MIPITRRAALAGVASLPLRIGSGRAEAPPDDVAIGGDAPWAHSATLSAYAWELAELLNDHGDGKWFVQIYPSKSTPFAVAFTRMERVS